MENGIKERLVGEYEKSDSLNKNIKDLMEIIIYVNFGEKIGRLYKLINDNDLFSKIINEFYETEIEFPTKDEFIECVMTSMVYYYKEILGFDWEKIQKLLPYERDVSLRYGRKMNKLSNKIKKELNRLKNNII